MCIRDSPYWKGKSNRERIFKNVTSEWKDAYEAGIFTEFQEQRAPGHTVLGMKMFRTGLNDLKSEIHAALEKLDLLDEMCIRDRNENCHQRYTKICF